MAASTGVAGQKQKIVAAQSRPKLRMRARKVTNCGPAEKHRSESSRNFCPPATPWPALTFHLELCRVKRRGRASSFGRRWNCQTARRGLFALALTSPDWSHPRSSGSLVGVLALVLRIDSGPESGRDPGARGNEVGQKGAGPSTKILDVSTIFGLRSLSLFTGRRFHNLIYAYTHARAHTHSACVCVLVFFCDT